MVTTTIPSTEPAGLSAGRLRLLRAGYLFVGVGLVIVKWPLLPDAHAMPLYEGVTLCWLVAMSLLAFVGAIRPLTLLPLLVLETLWKLLWLGVVALPQALAGDLDQATTSVAVNCAFVVVVVMATPWDVVWRSIVRGR